MNSLKMAIRSKDGKTCILGMIAGILFACIGGYLLQDSTPVCDIVVLSGSLFSMVGAEKFCRLIIQFRQELGEE